MFSRSFFHTLFLSVVTSSYASVFAEDSRVVFSLGDGVRVTRPVAVLGLFISPKDPSVRGSASMPSPVPRNGIFCVTDDVFGCEKNDDDVVVVGVVVIVVDPAAGVVGVTTLMSLSLLPPLWSFGVVVSLL